MQNFRFYDIMDEVSRMVDYPLNQLLDIHMTKCVQESPLIAATERELAAAKYILLVTFCNHDENILADRVYMKKHGFKVGKRLYMIANQHAIHKKKE